MKRSQQNIRPPRPLIMVTGAGGYLGSVLVEELLARRYRVRAVDQRMTDLARYRSHHESGTLDLVLEDIRNLTAASFEGVAGVVDLGALSNHPDGAYDRELSESVNLTGRVHVARCAREAGVGHYAFGSSCSVYGDVGDDSVNEHTEPAPATVYARCSLAAEEETRALASPDFRWTALRLGAAFGAAPHMRYDLAVNCMVLSAVETGQIALNGSGLEWRPLVHVRDTARAFIQVLRAPREAVDGEIFNIGLENRRLSYLAGLVRDRVEHHFDTRRVNSGGAWPRAVEILSRPQLTTFSCNVSFAKMRERLGFQPVQSIVEGIDEMCIALLQEDRPAIPAHTRQGVLVGGHSTKRDVASPVIG